MILLIDAGNTRVKCALLDGPTWRPHRTFEQGDEGALEEMAASCPPIDDAFGSNVAGPDVAARIGQALTTHGVVPRWLTASPYCCGVRNTYTQAQQLGADRWAALIGAHAVHRGACVVVTAGTATTIDLLDATGCFRGGLILPGIELMRRALARNTAQLPFADGRYVDTPRNTADAIVSGCLNAQAGAVERMFRQIAGSADALCLLSGGAADQLAGLLTLPLRREENLVLDGLGLIARTERSGEPG